MYIDPKKLFPLYININEVYLSESVEYDLLCVHCILCRDAIISHCRMLEYVTRLMIFSIC